MKSPTISKSESYSMQVQAALVKLGVDELELRKALPFTEVLKETTGGLPEVIGAMRFSNDSSIVAFLKEYDRVHEKDRTNLPWEAFAVKAGVDIPHLLGAIYLALHQHTANMVKFIAFTHHPAVMKASIENALRPSGIRDRNALHKMHGFLPIRKGDTSVFFLPARKAAFRPTSNRTTSISTMFFRLLSRLKRCWGVSD